MDLFETLIRDIDFSPLRSHAVWLAITYAGVLVAMALDFVCGVRKARKAGIATTSKGYKMTCDKAVKYFLPMLCLSVVDVYTCTIIPLPVFTMGIGSFNIFCEFKSVMEKTHEKAEMRRAERTMSLIVENYNDLGAAISAAVREALKEGRHDDTEA